MTAPVLKSKTTPPQVAGPFVARPRLFTLLDPRESGLPLTVIAAPPGYGKTTLVAEWSRHTSTPLAWISLDENDDTPERFSGLFLAAVESVLPVGIRRYR